MDEREAIRKSLSYLRAPAGTLDAVLDKIEQEEEAEAPAPVPINTTQMQKTRHAARQIRRTTVIAAVFAALLSVTALAAVLSRIDLESGFFGTFQVSFKPTDEDFIEVGYWYPEDLPAGFGETFVSDWSYQGQSMGFENDAGDSIRFEYTPARDSYGVSLSPGAEEYDVQVSGTDAKLYTAPGGEDGLHGGVLFWTDPEKGVGFSLGYEGEAQVDLIALAESVKPQAEPRPSSFTESAKEALAELGGYMPDLPDGYALTETHAFPTSMGGGWYGYVRRRFENDSHQAIELYYETFPGAGDTASDPLELMVGDARTRTDEYTCTDVTVWGLPACVVERKDGSLPLTVKWYAADAGPEGMGLRFTLSADTLTADELTALAETISLSK